MEKRRLPAIAVALVVFAGAACGTGPPSATTSLHASPEPTASPSPTPTSTPSATRAEAWRPVPNQASVNGLQFQSVVWTGARFVATGAAPDGSGAFLDSSDGATWHRQPTSAATARPASLAVGPDGVVAVGTIDDRPASWFSPDGLTWTARADAFPVTTSVTDTSAVTAVVATDVGWLAVGREDPYCQMDCGLAPVRAIAWASSDGLDWARVADQASLGEAAMTGVSRGGPGFVAVGLAGAHAAAWLSTDQTSWTRVADSPPFHALPSADPSLWTTMTAVAAGHGVVVAVGNEGPGGGHGPAARAWWSADGRTWAPADGDYFASGGEISVIPTSVAATPAGFLATASTNGGCTGGIWASTDGHAWRCVASNPAIAGFRPHAAAASSSVEVAVGYDQGSANGAAGAVTAAVWLRILP